MWRTIEFPANLVRVALPRPLVNPPLQTLGPMSIPAPADPSLEPSSRLEITRLGNTKQCPICGSDVHSDAYHCTRCRSFFCYHCRAKLGADEVILQCGNQDCGFYGKWVCSVCDPATQKAEPPLEYDEPVDGYWPAWLLASIFMGLLAAWYINWSSALIVFAGMYAGLGYLLQSMDVNIFGKLRRASMERSSEVHSCICCSSPTKKTGLRQRA